MDADVLDVKSDALEHELRRLDRVVVAFSGGADSTYLTAVARRALGRERVRAVTAVSPSLPAAERDECASLASELDVEWATVATDEFDRAEYRRNDAERCYHCKSALMEALVPMAASEQATVVLGVNVDDLGEHRPGQRAAREAGALFPLVLAGFTKYDVREASRRLGLPTWDKPAAACLASRVPYGTQVSVDVVGRVERAERALRRLGLSQVRVRHYQRTARIEVELDELTTLMDRRAEVVAVVREAGYRYVTVDLEGFRSGNLNADLGL